MKRLLRYHIHCRTIRTKRLERLFLLTCFAMGIVLLWLSSVLLRDSTASGMMKRGMRRMRTRRQIRGDVRRTKTQCATDFYQNRSRDKGNNPSGGILLHQCVGEVGRLGNTMFAYASSLGIAQLDHRTMVVDLTNLLLRYFKLEALISCSAYCVYCKNSDDINNSSVISSSSTLCQNATAVQEDFPSKFKPALLHSRPRVLSLTVYGFLQSWRYFVHVEHDLRRQFTPYGGTAKHADITIGMIRKKFQMTGRDVTLIGVHVRRGDMKLKHHQKFGYQTAPVDYFRHAMEWSIKEFHHVVFVISSDKKRYMREHILPLCTDLQTHNEFLRANATMTNTATSREDRLLQKNTSSNPAPSPGMPKTFHESSSTNPITGSGFHPERMFFNNTELVSQTISGTASPQSHLQSKKNPLITVKTSADNPGATRERAFRQKTPKVISSVTKSWAPPERKSKEKTPQETRRKARLPEEAASPTSRTSVGCEDIRSRVAAWDMAVLGSCDHLIMSVGTFGWWSGWLTGGKVVYYRHPVRPGSDLWKLFNASDFYPPHWIPME